MAYRVGIVGERAFPVGVAQARTGMVATISRELDNPHDKHALRVDVEGETVGYIARDDWLRDALKSGRKSVVAVVHEVVTKKGNSGIVLSVELVGGDGLLTVNYAEPVCKSAHAVSPRNAGGGILSGLLRGLFR